MKLEHPCITVANSGSDLVERTESLSAAALEEKKSSRRSHYHASCCPVKFISSTSSIPVSNDPSRGSQISPEMPKITCFHSREAFDRRRFGNISVLGQLSVWLSVANEKSQSAGS